MEAKKLWSKRFSVKIDIIMLFLVALATTILGVGLTWDDPFSIRVAILLVMGLSGALFTQTMFPTIGKDLSITKQEWYQILTWFIIDASVIAIYTYFIRVSVPLQTIDNQYLAKISSAGVGIAEELFFGLFLTPLFVSLTGGLHNLSVLNLMMSLLGVMGIFMLYHIYVYGFDPQALIIVSGGRGILSLSVIMTQRVTSATLAHAGVNFLVA